MISKRTSLPTRSRRRTGCAPGAPAETAVYAGGEPYYTVNGHRWGDDGYFVLAQDETGKATVIPYMETKDKHGMLLYEEHRFIAPTATEAAPSRDTREFIPSDREPVAKLTGDELGIEFNGPNDMPALRRAAQRWYDQNLKGQIVERPDGTPVKFGNSGRREATKGNKTDFILRAVPAIRSIIERGEVVSREPGNKYGVRENVVVSAPVNLGGVTRRLVVTLHVQQDGTWHYDLDMTGRTRSLAVRGSVFPKEPRNRFRWVSLHHKAPPAGLI